VQAAHGAQGTQDGAGGRIAGSLRPRNQFSTSVARARAGVGSPYADRLEQLRLRRRLAQLQASSALRLCTGRQVQRSTTRILLELARALRHAWTPARAGGRQRVARSLSPAQQSAAAMAMDGSIFFEK